MNVYACVCIHVCVCTPVCVCVCVSVMYVCVQNVVHTPVLYVCVDREVYDQNIVHSARGYLTF